VEAIHEHIIMITTHLSYLIYFFYLLLAFIALIVLINRGFKTMLWYVLIVPTLMMGITFAVDFVFLGLLYLLWPNVEFTSAVAIGAALHVVFMLLTFLHVLSWIKR